jgi:hypothetical protein
MTLVCRPTPFVRFIHTSEHCSKQLMYRMARFLNAVAFLPLALCQRTRPKRYLVENVHSKNYLSLLAQGAKNGNCFPPAGGAAYIPSSKDRGLWPRFGKSPGDVAE